MKSGTDEKSYNLNEKGNAEKNVGFHIVRGLGFNISKSMKK